MKFHKIYQYILIISAFWCTSCQESLDSVSIDDSRVYISNFDPTADFSTYKTYHLPDTVFVINGENIRASTSANSKTFLFHFIENLNEYPYKKVDIQAKPDLGIQISRVSNAKIGKDAYFNGYFNNYWQFQNFGNKGFEYPGIYDQYEHGDVVWNIEVLDLKNAAKNQKLKVLWNAQIWGLQVLTEEDYAFMVNKIFKISSFLPKK